MESTEEMAPFVTAHGCVWTPEMTLRSPAQLDKLVTILRALRGQMSWPHEDDPEREPAWMTPIVATAEQHAAAGLRGPAERLEALVASDAVLRGFLVDELGGRVRTPSAAVRFVAESLEHLARTKWAEGQSRSDHDAQRETALAVGQADFRSAALLRHLADLLDLNARPAGAVQPEAQDAGAPIAGGVP